MYKQHPLTILAPVDPSKRGQLGALLDQIQQPDIEKNQLLPFPKIKSIHFSRFVILDSPSNHFSIQLVFASDYDGEESAHIAELIREAKGGLSQIYFCCIGFTGDLESYWRTYQVKTTAFYNGHPGLAAPQISHSEVLRTTIADYLAERASRGELQNLSAVQIKQAIAAFINKEHSHLLSRYPVMSPFQKFLFHRKTLLMSILLALTGLVLTGYLFVGLSRLVNIHPGVVAFTLIVLLLGVVYYYKRKLNRLEDSDPTQFIMPPSQHVKRLMHMENFQVQNQLTHLVEIKEGSFRHRLLFIVLKAINFLAKAYFNKGSLGSIPSIHFARWIIIDGGRRLIFFFKF